MQLDINKYFALNHILNNSRKYSYLDDSELDFESEVGHTQRVYILDNLCAINVSGVDAQTFLQGQLTTDLNQKPIAPMSCYLSRKGRIISFFYITEQPGGYCLFMPTDISDVFINQIKKYIFKSNVNIDKLSAPVVSISPDLRSDLNINDLTYVNLDKEIVVLANGSLLQHISENKALLSIQGSWAWHKRQLQNHQPSIYPETIAKFLMHETNLHQSCAVDFKKGCFIGQEIVARMHYKSKIQYRIKLVPLSKTIMSDLNETVTVNNNKNYLVLDQIYNHGDKWCLLSYKG